eukprot:6012025-Prymnesium_polylepis.1
MADCEGLDWCAGGNMLCWTFDVFTDFKNVCWGIQSNTKACKGVPDGGTPLSSRDAVLRAVAAAVATSLAPAADSVTAATVAPITAVALRTVAAVVTATVAGATGTFFAAAVSAAAAAAIAVAPALT